MLTPSWRRSRSPIPRSAPRSTSRRRRRRSSTARRSRLPRRTPARRSATRSTAASRRGLCSLHRTSASRTHGHRQGPRVRPGLDDRFVATAAFTRVAPRDAAAVAPASLAPASRAGPTRASGPSRPTSRRSNRSGRSHWPPSACRRTAPPTVSAWRARLSRRAGRRSLHLQLRSADASELRIDGAVVVENESPDFISRFGKAALQAGSIPSRCASSTVPSSSRASSWRWTPRTSRSRRCDGASCSTCGSPSNAARRAIRPRTPPAARAMSSSAAFVGKRTRLNDGTATGAFDEDRRAIRGFCVAAARGSGGRVARHDALQRRR